MQVRQGTALTPKALHGRGEHIVSGQATLCTSREGVWALRAQGLATLGPAPDA